MSPPERPHQLLILYVLLLAMRQPKFITASFASLYQENSNATNTMQLLLFRLVGVQPKAALSFSDKEEVGDESLSGSHPSIVPGKRSHLSLLLESAMSVRLLIASVAIKMIVLKSYNLFVTSSKMATMSVFPARKEYKPSLKCAGLLWIGLRQR